MSLPKSDLSGLHRVLPVAAFGEEPHHLAGSITTAEPHLHPTLANISMVAQAEVMEPNIQAVSVVILCGLQFKPSTENQAVSRAYLPFLAVPL